MNMFYLSTHRYHNEWLPGIICDHFLVPRTHYAKDFTLFLARLNHQMVAIVFAMMELNLKEYASTGLRVPSLSKRCNPLEGMNSAPHLVYY